MVSFGAETHAVHYELEPGDRIRMVLDGKVFAMHLILNCVRLFTARPDLISMQVVYLEKEKDPSQLVAPYGGKLTRYVVDDGTHLAKVRDRAERSRREIAPRDRAECRHARYHGAGRAIR